MNFAISICMIFVFTSIFLILIISIKFIGVTDTVFAFSWGIYNTVSSGFSMVVNNGQSPPVKNYKNYPYGNQNNKDSNRNNNNKRSGVFGFLFKSPVNAMQRTNHVRGRHINPWRPFWEFINNNSNNKKNEKKKLSWFRSLYVGTPTVGSKLLAG